MKKWLCIVGGLLVAGILVLLARRASGPAEPVFEGRTLTSWLENHTASSSANPPFGSPGWKQANEALRQIGSNAVPTLVEMIRAKDPPSPILKLLIGAQRRVPIRYRYAYSRQQEAEYAFEVLGTNAAAAVPELIKIYETESPESQRSAAVALGRIGRPAQAAVPVLVKNFHDTNVQVRFYAVSAVMQIGGETDIVVPALVGALQDSCVDVRWNAISGLERLWSRARPAVPELLKMLDDPGMVSSHSMIQHATTAIWRIAPEKVGHPLVLEESTPMVVDGVIKEDLSVTLHGERHPMIREGRPDPAVAQIWNSDPRPSFMLHRGTGGPDGKGQFLGEFEVTGLPPSPDVNISTLCMIADGRILLSARDNTREMFLPVRRVDHATGK